MRNRIYITLLCLMALAGTKASDFVPVITNFSSLDYDGGLQNWGITQDNDGLMHFGNNVGVLSFDGYSWECSRLPGKPIVRSLLAVGRRLYVGAYQEFGYYERNNFGRLQYTSLWKMVKGYKPHNDEIWNILRTADGRILFQSFCSWFEYDGRSVRVHYRPDVLPLYFFNVGSGVYAQLVDDGFFRVSGDRYVKLLDRRMTGNDDVVAALPWQNGTMLLCTEFHGLFTYDGRRLQPLHTEADDQLRQAQANRAVITHDGTIVVGTILDGIYGFSPQGRLKWHYNTHNQLHNNTVLGLFCDHDNNVWAALDVGIALIHSGAPYALLTGAGTSLGMVYDIYPLPGMMYIATNQNTVLYKDSRLTPVAGTAGQNWHLTNFGNQLIVGNNHGTKSISGTTATNLTGSGNASSTCIRRYNVGNDRDFFIESSYTELRIYQHISNTWQYVNKADGFMAPVNQFEIDSHGVIWAAHMSSGVYRIELSGDLKRVTSLRYYPALRKGSNGSKIHVMKIRGEVVLADDRQLYLVGSDNTVRPYQALNAVAGRGIISATTIDNSHFWLSSNRGYTLMEYRNATFHRQLYVPAAFFGLECGDNQNKVRIDGNMAYFCLNGGLGRMDMTARQQPNTRKGRLLLSRAEYFNADRKPFPVTVTAGNPAVKGTVKLELSYSNYNNEPLRFLFQLEGGGLHLQSQSEKPTVVYTDLNYGSYTFHAKVADVNGKVLGQLTYRFHYPRPLLLSIPMLLLYAALFMGLIYLYIRWSTKRIIRRQARITEAEQMRKNLQLAEQQRIIEAQQKQLLEQQLQDKGREIASLAMDAVKHKQQVTDIRHELAGQRLKGLKGNKEIERMLSHITDDLDTDAYWDIYRENFDLIHKNFFRHLRKQFPTLTSTDLKFCALLRLNLSTKDIAHFAGLTVRGVEGARYRLRKKLRIAEGQNLTEFLIDFK